MSKTIYTSGAGSTLSSVLKIKEDLYKALYTTSGWNSIVRAGLHEAGQLFVKVDLPRRFTPFAKSNLGYRGRNPTPLVVNGRLSSYMLPRAYAEARVTGERASVIIRMPSPTMLESGGALKVLKKVFASKTTGYTYWANPKVAEVLKTITNAELQKMAETLSSVMAGLITGSVTKTNRVGRTSMSLTIQQRKSIAHTKKPQGTKG